MLLWQGAAPAIGAHPHVAIWRQVGGLVTDGALFTKAWVRAKRGLDDETPPAAAAATVLATQEANYAHQQELDIPLMMQKDHSPKG